MLTCRFLHAHRWALLVAVASLAPPAWAQSDDADLLAPLTPPASDDSDLLAPLVPDTADDDLLAPLVPPTSEDSDLLAPLVPEEADDDDLLAPLVPESALEEDLLAPLVRPDQAPKQLSEEQLIVKGAATLRSPDDVHKAIAHSIEWAGREMDKAMKGKLSDEELRKAIEAVNKMDGITEMRSPQRRPGKKPLPMVIDVAEQAEWQRRQQESNGTTVLVERPMEVTRCNAGQCTTRLEMQYELQPVGSPSP